MKRIFMKNKKFKARKGKERRLNGKGIKLKLLDSKEKNMKITEVGSYQNWQKVNFADARDSSVLSGYQRMKLQNYSKEFMICHKKTSKICTFSR
ncbi:hypothetical protein J6590_070768 [Homalodisca vitripennis]|nr:hypothetical protein J6590_070768 [Homalodisca vitripennis]